MIKNYKLFTEGVRDKMTPKSKEDIKNTLSEDNVVNKIKNIFKYNIQHYYTEEELRKMIEDATEYMSFAEQTEFAIDYNMPWIIEDLYKEGYFDYESIVKDAILYAFKQGSIDIVKLLLEKGVDVNYINTTTLERAISREKKKELRKLLHDYKWERSTLDESLRDKMIPKSIEEIKKSIENMTPYEKLIYGVDEDIPWLVEESLDEGADIHYGEDRALHNSIEYGHSDIVKILIDRGANVHERDNLFLIRAIVLNHIDIVKLLIEAGCDIHIKQDLPIILARRYKRNDITRLLSDYESGNQINEGIRDKMTPKPEEDVKRALKGAAPDRKIIIGVSNGLTWLVEAGIKEGASGDTLSSGLANACHKGYNDIAKMLLDAGADVHRQQDVCIQRSVDSKNIELLKILIDAGADVNANFDYALRWACIHDDVKMAKILLEAGAKPTIANGYPMKMAIRNNNNELIELLKKYINK